MADVSTLRELFGIDSDMPVPMLEDDSDLVPRIDENYRFDPEVTRAVLAGFSHGSRVLVQGLHGTGKSTHHRTDRRSPQLAAHARQPRRADLPVRPRG